MRTVHYFTTAFWFVAGLTLSVNPLPSAADDAWESLPSGIQGQRAEFDGVGGIRIAGYVRKPSGPGPFPLVIFIHGGAPTAKPVQATAGEELAKLRAAEATRASNQLGRANHPPLPDFLAQGWAVYSIDFRPNPRYTLDPLEWDDTLIAINKARNWSFVVANRIAMVGGSHGGHVVGRMVSRTPLVCAVLNAPAGLDLISLSKLADQGTNIGGNQRLVREFEQRAGVKIAAAEKDPAAYQYSSLLTEVPQAKCPILMVSGKNDQNAPLPVMEAYVKAMNAAGHEAVSYHPDNGPHGFYFGLPQTIPETAESTRHAIEFIKRQFAAVKP
jgi:dipeptidyl aminopeptidase/acylaminoacyl peptidase